ncbi:MAG: hypothetical protein Q8919_15055, partial [Bacteroidota bacterium]|nr:hypothetical protein [Bacteroidota bacterium]
MKQILVTILLASIFISTVRAQRSVSPATNSGCFRQSVQPIQRIPQLHSDMNADCIQGYTYLDSLCRCTFSWAHLDSMGNTILTPGALKPFMIFEYRMREYNADLLKEYQVAAGELNKEYCHNPAAVMDVVG